VIFEVHIVLSPCVVHAIFLLLLMMPIEYLGVSNIVGACYFLAIVDDANRVLGCH